MDDRLLVPGAMEIRFADSDMLHTGSSCYLQDLPDASALQAYDFAKPGGREMACCHDNLLLFQTLRQGAPRLACHFRIHISPRHPSVPATGPDCVRHPPG